MEPPSRLLALPDELLLQILGHANYTSRITQQLTCRRLRNIVLDLPAPRETARCLDLLLLEQLLDKPSLYTCTHCIRLRPRSTFVLSQTRDCPKGYWDAEALLRREEKGPQKLAEAFLFNRRTAPIDPAQRRMIAASIDAGLYRRHPALQASLANASQPATPAIPQSNHPALPPGASRDSNMHSGPKAKKISRPPHAERICIECGVKQHLWSSSFTLRYPLDDEAKELGTGIICKRCNNFAACAPDSRVMLTKRCEKCLEYRPPGARRAQYSTSTSAPQKWV